MSGIPTKYRGIRFRSRLEATWARFFDMIGWDWEYEPCDFDGYIPDFVIRWPHPIYVEVKPDHTTEDLERHIPKALRAGVNRLLVVGSGIIRSETWGDGATLGVALTENCCGNDDERMGTEPEPAIVVTCLKCKRTTFIVSYGGWSCTACGHYDGDSGFSIYPYDDLFAMWARAKNLTQWKGEAA